ncbi:MAG: sugar transferase [Chloroflexi bacterium]|nr:sugar transferase [Chloroflexota bacterium]
MRRLRDFCLATIGLILLSPLFVVVAAVIKLDSPGPVLFRQQRVGRNGTTFRIFKFRTMVKDAPNMGPHYTDNNDPRITRVGGLLRRTSIDELPQLLNVVLGHMSLVGPRPITPEQVDYYTPAQFQARHSAPPGITGLAQINGRSLLTFQESLEWDLTYVRSASLWTDLVIILRTVRQVLSGRGTN